MRIQHLGSLTFKLTSAIALCIGLAACGGDGNGLSNAPGGGGNNGGGNGGGGDTGNDLAQIGRGAGSNFIPGEIGVGIGESTLSAGGNTLLTVNVVNNGNLITDSVDVSFNSPCFAAGEALLQPQSTNTEIEGESSTNVVQTTNGQATIRYTANGCIGGDTITATTTYGGSVITATTTLDVAADTITSLAFIDASPSFITLKGTGGTETSTVRFRVRGSTGAPVKDVGVSFSLNTTAGGLALVNSSDTSGVDGYVYTTVQSGTVPTSVRITATTDGGISTQSSSMVVSTGLPDQNSFSIAATEVAPNSWDINGVESVLTINAADAFNNPVPAGTPIYFTTNGGNIDSACLINESTDSPLGSTGSCSATWRSANPKPRADVPFIVDENALTIRCPEGIAECRNGRFKVIATTIGNESFIDTNGNGLFDFGTDVFYNADSPEGNTDWREQNCMQSEPVSGSSSHQTSGGASQAYGCDDLGDPYIDRNFNGRYDTNEEIATVDFGVDTSYNEGNGLYNGALCRPADADAGRCSREPVLVRAEMTMVMSCNAPLFVGGGRLPGQPTSAVPVPYGGSVRIDMLLADCNGNGIPGGTEISVNDGAAINIDGAEVSPEGELASSTEPGIISLFVVGSDEDPAGGTVFVEIAIPGAGDGQTKYSVGIDLTPDGEPPSED